MKSCDFGILEYRELLTYSDAFLPLLLKNCGTYSRERISLQQNLGENLSRVETTAVRCYDGCVASCERRVNALICIRFSADQKRDLIYYSD